MQNNYKRLLSVALNAYSRVIDERERYKTMLVEIKKEVKKRDYGEWGKKLLLILEDIK